MKGLSSSLLHWLAIVGCAAAQNAYLYNLDIHPRSSSSSRFPSIDTETAIDILARRLGAAELIELGRVDDDILEHLNQYGGQQRLPLFGDEGPTSRPDRVVIAIEGYDGTLGNKYSRLLRLLIPLMLFRATITLLTWDYNR
jgi:hypothetical protein